MTVSKHLWGPGVVALNPNFPHQVNRNEKFTILNLTTRSDPLPPPYLKQIQDRIFLATFDVIPRVSLCYFDTRCKVTVNLDNVSNCCEKIGACLSVTAFVNMLTTKMTMSNGYK